MDLLAGWYPGLGEVETIRRMSPLVQEFIADAVAEDENFLEGYLLPILERPEPERLGALRRRSLVDRIGRGSGTGRGHGHLSRGETGSSHDFCRSIFLACSLSQKTVSA